MGLVGVEEGRKVGVVIDDEASVLGSWAHIECVRVVRN